MGRVARSALVALALTAAGARPVHAAPPPLRVFADLDDDDADGVADASEPVIAASARDVVAVTGAKGVQGDAARLVRGGVQGVHAGSVTVQLAHGTREVAVVEVVPVDSTGARVDPATSHATPGRVLPPALAPAGAPPDQDALAWLAIGPAGALPAALSFRSTHPDGRPLDHLDGVKLEPAACPARTPAGLVCARTKPIRAGTDPIDRQHPAALDNTLLAEVGGRIVVLADGEKASSIRVGGPRSSPIGPIERLRAHLRLRVLRIAPGGAPAIGGDDKGALALARDQIETASQLWGQCGIHFGLRDKLDVEVVDPPPPHMIAVGCDLGVPASGGAIAFRAGKHVIRVATRAGQTPDEVAGELAEATRRAGLSATVSPNPRIGAGALPTVDVLVRTRRGEIVPLAAVGDAPLSTDATLDACLGEVDLADGLTHFTDFDAVAGTVEERSLLKAFDDGDPTTIEMYIVPSFAKTGRIGESFLLADGASVSNAIIVDRAAVRAGARSFALAHELGHVLLDMPGHPDDYGVDQPSSLMDADAADPTIFGPRRLSLEECVRAVQESGPDAPVPILRAWPMTKPRR